jgi:Putative zinc-finger
MNYENTRTAHHPEISELIPWYVNGTIGAIDRQKLDAHFQICAACRDELLQERRVHEAMSADSGIEYMPAASFKRLQARLDEPDEAQASVRRAPLLSSRAQARRAGRRMPWQRLAAASIAVMAVSISLVSADRWYRLRGRDLPSDYHTVTTGVPRAPNEVIRAVFSPTITLVELQAILDEAQLRIVAGPTEAGVYSLAANSDRPVNSSLALLRRHAAVRFAESTQLGEPRAPGDSR